jgi:hypothetical protein
MMRTNNTIDNEHRASRFYSMRRVAILAAAVIDDVPGATSAVCALVSLAFAMMARLNAQQQSHVLSHLHREVGLLRTSPDGGQSLKLN